jgi:hypothetical protein
MDSRPIESISLVGPRARSNCACAERPLVTLVGTAPLGLRAQDVALVFEVARDEEHVGLRMTSGGRTLDMGGRSHNYILLTLARRRLADAAEQLPSTSCGWMYHDDLARGPAASRTQLNTDIFRIRRQFGRAGLLDPDAIIERRQAAGQLRIGTSNLTIVVC